MLKTNIILRNKSQFIFYNHNTIDDLTKQLNSVKLKF